MIRIRLTKKLAAILNGVDLSLLRVGDVVEMSEPAGAMLIAEAWAERVPDPLLPHLTVSQPTQTDFANS
jgi:hypothetical protein